MQQPPFDLQVAGPGQAGRWSNAVGAAASGLCAIHCALAPLLFTAGPVLAKAAHTYRGEAAVWEGLNYVFLALSLAAVYVSGRHVHDGRLRLALWAAWALFAGGLALEELGVGAGEGLMYAGSAALIILHATNLWRLGSWREALTYRTSPS